MRKIPVFITVILAVILFLSGCSSSAENNGILKGKVTIGPLTPVVRIGETPAPVSPEVFTSHGIEISKSGEDKIFKTVYFNGDGTYNVTLPEGSYSVKLIPSGISNAQGLPATITIKKGWETILNINIDTGIR